MSAMHQEESVDQHDDVDHSGSDETIVAGTPVVVRRNAGLAAVIGAGASAIAIAYLWRAVETGAPLDWALCLVLSLIAGFYLAGLLDARTPLVVADDLGVRIRLGRQWRGLPWDAVAAVEVRPRRSAVHDGRLVFRPHSLGRALDGLEVRGRRHAALNQKVFGAALAVPLGLTTRTSVANDALADELAALSRGRADVLVVAPEPKAEPVDAAVEAPTTPDVEPPVLDEPVADEAFAQQPIDHQPVEIGQPEASDAGDDVDLDEPARAPRRSLLGGIGTIVSRVAKGSSHDVDVAHPAVDSADEAESDSETEPEAPEPKTPVLPAAVVADLRPTRPALRAEVTRDLPATQLGAAAHALDPDARDRRGTLPEGRELRRPGSVDLVFEPVDSAVRPIAKLGDPVEPLVIDGFVTEPAYDPIIGPELAAARTRVGLTVDELADRTRIRPHVIESIEVDDFSPCGGDFYARGHLRTLARVLGQDPAPLLVKFDDRYATAPINARRVFEAELATGMTGSMRSTVGGPNWGLLVGAVLSLVLVWGLVRLFATEPPQLIQSPTPLVNGSAGVDTAFPSAAKPQPVSKPMPIMLVATQAGSRVVVRDGDGKVVFTGELVIGERKKLKVDPPVRVQAANSGAVEVRVRGKDRGPVGELGEPGRRTFTRPTSR